MSDGYPSTGVAPLTMITRGIFSLAFFEKKFRP